MPFAPPRVRLASVSGGSNPLALSYDATDKASLTLGGANGTLIHGVTSGVADSDAVNVGQMHTYVDGSAQQTLGSATSYAQQLNQGTVNLVNVAMSTEQQDVASLFNAINALPKGTGTSMPNTLAVDGGTAASVASNSGGVAIGNGAAAGGSNGTAIGGGSFAAGPNDTALGGNAKVGADGSTAVGANTNVTAAATNAVAVGEHASVTDASGTAIGQNASATAANSVALGQGSVANVANTVSVGTATNQRTITNVAAGVNATDAANVGQVNSQVNAALATAKTYTDASSSQTLQAAKAYTDAALGNQQTLSDLRTQMNDQFNQVNKRINDQGAMGAASTQMAINAAGATGIGRLAAGVGYQGSRSALSVGYAAPVGSTAHLSVGATTSGSQTSVGAGFGIDL